MDLGFIRWVLGTPVLGSSQVSASLPRSALRTPDQAPAPETRSLVASSEQGLESDTSHLAVVCPGQQACAERAD